MDDEHIEMLLERFVGAVEKIADELEVIRYIAAKEQVETEERWTPTNYKEEE